MPLRGLVADWSKLELRVRLQVTGSCSANVGYVSSYGAEAYLVTNYRNAFGSMVVGVRVDLETIEESDGTLAYSRRLQVPALGVDVTDSGASFDSDQDSVLTFTGVKLYVVEGSATPVWNLRASGYTWAVDGSTLSTGGAIDLTSSDLRPLSVPLIGTPAALGVSPTALAPGTAVIVGPPGGSAQATATVTGGWRYEAGSAWRTPNVSLVVRPSESVSCPFPIGSQATVSATNTYDLSMQASAQADTTGGGLVATGSGAAGEVTLLPDLPNTIVRLETPHKSLVRRRPLPRARQWSYATCAPISVGGGSTADSYTIEYEETGNGPAVYEDAPHSSEADLSRSVICPYSLQQSGFDLSVDGRVQGTATAGTQFPESVSSPAGRLTYLDQTDSVTAKYVSFWGNRLWSWVLQASAWDSLDSDLYWRKLRQQYLYESDLPSGEQYRTRNRQVAPPMAEDALAAWRESVRTDLTFKTSEVGICRFVSDKTGRDPSITLDSSSSSRWSADIDEDTVDDDTTPSFGATVTLPPKGGSSATRTVQFRMGSFSVVPWLYPEAASRIAVSWPTTNVASVKVELVGEEGSLVTLATAAGTYEWPLTGTSTRYAGSWDQDYGLGYATDSGVDTDLTLGISAATMADQLRQLAFGLLPGRTAKWLRFTVVPTDPTQNVQIDYPTFEVDEPDALVREDAPWACALWPDGPGLRLGQVGWWNYVLDSFAAAGVQLAPGSVMSALDWYCLKRVVFQGIDPASGLDAEWAADWDPLEFTARAHLARNPDRMAQHTHAFLAVDSTGEELLGVMVNSLREVPPMAVWPHSDRDADLAPTYAPSGKVWSLAQADANIVAPVAGVEHRTYPAGLVLTSAEADPTDGWKVVSHEAVVDNTDTQDDFRVYIGADERAKATTWHGYFTVPGLASSGEGLSYDVSDSQRHLRAYVSGSSLYVGWAPNVPLPLAFSDAAVLSNVTEPCVRWDRLRGDQRVWLAGVEAGSVKLWRSTDGGASFSSVATVGSGDRPTMHWSPGGSWLLFWRDGTAVKVRRYDTSGTAVGSVVTVVASGVDDAGLASYDQPDGTGGLRTVLLSVESGTVYRRTSTDGGAAWSARSSVAAGTMPTAFCSKAGRAHEYWIAVPALSATANVRGHVRDVQGTSVGSAFDATGVADQTEPLAAMESYSAGGEQRTVLWFVDSAGLLQQRHSFDGRTFVS